MPGIFVALFWIWLAVATAVIVYRLATTGTIRDGGRKTSKPTPEEEAAASAERHAAFAAQLAAATDTDRTTGSERSATTAVPAVRTLQEALDGIAMPADLVPYAGDTFDPRHMLFATDTATPEDVGTSLADELERLGFDLEPLDERSVAAVKPDARVEIRILPDEPVGTSPLAGRVPPGSVVAEFQLS